DTTDGANLKTEVELTGQAAAGQVWTLMLGTATSTAPDTITYMAAAADDLPDIAQNLATQLTTQFPATYSVNVLSRAITISRTDNRAITAELTVSPSTNASKRIHAQVGLTGEPLLGEEWTLKLQ